MECKLTHDTVEVREVMFDAMTEQPVELDCLLPDYCPNVFKVLKCKLVPKMTSARVTGNEAVIDGAATVFIVYLCEETNRICSFVQKHLFSKSVPLKAACEHPLVDVTMQTEYVSCRGVNSRRFDLRGTIGIFVRVTDRRPETVLGGAEGAGVQKKTVTRRMDGECRQVMKSFTVREELELPENHPPIASVLYHSASARVSDVKVIANKVIVKGEASLRFAYCPLGESAEPQTAEYTVPVSQIVDLPGVDDRFSCRVVLEPCSTELEPKTALDGESRVIAVEMGISCRCFCVLETEKELLSDLYSTGYVCDPAYKKVTFTRTRFLPSVTSMQQLSMDLPDEEITEVYDIWCDFARMTVRQEGEEAALDGELELCAFCASASGVPLAVDKRVEFHDRLGIGAGFPGGELRAEARVRSLSYHLTGDRKLDLRVEIELDLQAEQAVYQSVVAELNLDETKATPRADLPALTLYFADEGEQIWDIAKRYHTSVAAILEENDLETETLGQGGMLLIPLTD